MIKLPLGNYIIDELEKDGISVKTEPFSDIYNKMVTDLSSTGSVEINQFYNSRSPDISMWAITLLNSRYAISENWDVMHKIPLVHENTDLENNIVRFILRYKKRVLDGILKDLQNQLKEYPSADFNEVVTEIMKYKSIHNEISVELGTVVHK
jgi:DNA primase